MTDTLLIKHQIRERTNFNDWDFFKEEKGKEITGGTGHRQTGRP